MIPISKWGYSDLVFKYVPSIVWWCVSLVLFVPRLAVLLLLPEAAGREWHPLYKVWEFFAFD